MAAVQSPAHQASPSRRPQLVDPPDAVDQSTGDGSSQRSIVGRIGPWQLLRLLSESEMARVYAARPVERRGDCDAPYVLKVLRNNWWRNATAIEMQRRAAWAGRKASHPNLLPVLAAGVKAPPFYLVFPKLDGQSLADALKRQKRMPIALSLWIARQTAEALDALHTQAAMLHADVKPANVLLSNDGHATLIDLGFAHTPGRGGHWATRPVCGTLNYIAPETVASSLAADARSDLYSLGVMLYEMLAGELPLVADDVDELVRMHREAKPVCIRRQRHELPKSVASLVHRLLAKDPLRRPESAAATAYALMRLEIASFAA